MSVIRIGYQGEYASNSERAAKIFADRQKIDSEDFVPCRTSIGVLDALRSGAVQYGVVAIENSVGGIVQETQEALDGVEIEEIGKLSLTIKHYLYSAKKMPPSEIKAIYSHKQALAQCRENITRLCPGAICSEAEDTGLAAYLLAKGEYPDASAVICTEQAGEFHSLELIESDFQDRADNVTTFCMFRLPNLPQPSEDESEVLATFIVSPRFTEYATKALIIGAILVATFARDFLGYSSWASASAVSGFVAIFVLLLASKRRENWVNARLIGGYWKYVLFPEKGDEVPTQSHGLLRTVHIDRDDEGRLRLRGWREGDGKGHRWENKVVMVTAPGSQKGKLSYEYTNTHDHPEEQSLDGVVHLSWNRTKANHKVNRMSGWYLGFATSDVGRISYTRISKEEFDRVRFSNRKANG